MDPTLYDEIRAMRTEATERHVEIVQRLTVLETSQIPLNSLDGRVKSLEGWRSKIAGAIVVMNMMAGAAFTWLMKRH